MTIIPDEINRLKGEKGKPKFSPNVPEKEEDIQSPCVERRKNWSKSAKKPRIKIDRTEVNIDIVYELITQRKNKFALLKFIVFTVTVIPLVFQLLRGRRNSDSNIRH